MLWPLMARWEVEDVETREWIFRKMKGMGSRVGNALRMASDSMLAA